MQLYDLYGELMTMRAAAVKARLVFTKAEHEKWIHPPIHQGFYRSVELPAPPGWKPAVATSELSRCIDFDWKDKNGDTCQDYVAQKFCTLERGYGGGWVRMDEDLEDETFDDYATGGVTAVQACCDCGGGTTDRISDDTLGPQKMKGDDWTFEMETLSDRPRVLRIKGFLSDFEADYVRDLAGPHLNTDSGNDPATSWAPPKFGSWMDGNEDPTLQAIVDRGANLLHTDSDLCEGLQINRYFPGQQDDAHTDYFGDRAADRYATVLLYLGDEEGDPELEGGADTFPIAGQPPDVQGKLVESYG